MLVGAGFGRVVIIESLGPDRAGAGQYLSELVSSLVGEYGLSVDVSLIRCNGSVDFISELKKIENEAALGNCPILHVECHGHPLDGLEFLDGSSLEWSIVAGLLRPINAASRFNFLAVFSACFGGYFLGQMGAVYPAPCWCLIAPTKTVDGPEIFAGFRDFYSTLFASGDMGRAIKAISKHKLQRGRWLWEPAELWFETLVVGYLESFCTKAYARKRAKSIYRDLKRKRKPQLSIGASLRALRKNNRNILVDRYFETYFLIDSVPENSVRFNLVKKRVRSKLSDLRSSKKYVV